MRAIHLFVSVVLVACGGPGSVDGTVRGQKFSISDAVSSSVSIQTTAGQVNVAAILMSTSGKLCSDVGAHIEHPNQKVVTITLADINNLTFSTPTQPGTYSIYQSGTPPAKAATLDAIVLDGSCNGVDGSSSGAATGTVTLESVSGNQFKGSFDVALESGDHITGDFSPEGCPAVQQAINSTQQTTCQ